MPSTKKITRRSFIRRNAALAAGGALVPHLIPSHVLAAPGRPGANDRIGVGYIGCGRRANQLMGLPAEGRIVAGADVDINRAKKVAEKRKCRAYQDYRKLLESKDIDAVFVATPDHWHVLPSIHACQAGKDIYLEKPLTLTIREGRILVDTVRKYRRVLQTGSHRRSLNKHHLGCELVRNGVAGKIHTVLINNFPSPWECGLPEQPVPKGLNWDVWCGMTQPVAFNQDLYIQRSNPGWISFRPYSGGEMTGWGAHGFDQIQWALNLDQTGPVEVSAVGGKLKPVTYTKSETRERGDKFCSTGHEVTFRYANGIVIQTKEGEPGSGGVFIGDKGKIRIGNNTVNTNPVELVKTPPDSFKVRLPKSTNHIQNWFDSIKSREKPIADVEVGHRAATLCHLGNIARWVGRPLKWDPAKEIFPGDDEANTYLDRPRRKPYELPDPA
ncbi:MAG: Gfo/Idh/MocA family oxidoreductase [Pirellulales bacterium]|nr:Gfo/Idh/MocA family oxidoreductase [Pirellulales bacterium]